MHGKTSGGTMSIKGVHEVRVNQNIQHCGTVQIKIMEQPALDALQQLLQQPGGPGSFDFVFIGTSPQLRLSCCCIALHSIQRQKV